MWPFKSKFDKLKREDVVDAICNLEKQESDLESAIEERARTIEELLAKGRKESNRELKLFYAKKITTLREENQTDVQRAMYLMYNTKLLRKLKTTIDDNEFFVRTGKVSLGNLLADQKGLAQFLNKALGTKVGVIYDSSDDYSSGLYKGFSDKAAELGLEIVATTSFTADNKADLSTQVTQCQDAGADLVFLPIYYTEAAQILSYANKIGYAPKFFGCDGMDGILTVEGFDTSLAEGLALMTPFDANASDEATQSFVAKFKEKMDGLVPNQFAADGYDVIYALYNAMTAAGITGSESASEICTALEAQFATMTIDGLTGTGMHWDENGMISKAPAAVVIENGVYVPMG